MKEKLLQYALKHWGLDLTRCLDMGCGSGLMTKYLFKYGAGEVDSSDPGDFAAGNFEKEFGRSCLRYGFEHVAGGSFPGRDYTLVVCAYSMHFMKKSLMPAFMAGAVKLTNTLLVISPRDKPVIDSPDWLQAREFQSRSRAMVRLFTTKSSLP